MGTKKIDSIGLNKTDIVIKNGNDYFDSDLELIELPRKPTIKKEIVKEDIQVDNDWKSDDEIFIPTWDNQPPPAEPVVLCNGISILTKENITCLIAEPGAGKSSVFSSIISSIINPNCDSLNMKVNAKNILLIDFEMTRIDIWKSFNNTMKRAKVSPGTNINSIRIVSLRAKSTAQQRKEIIIKILEEKSFDLILIDGVGDLLDDTNSLDQAITVKNWCRFITSKYKTSILTTLHPNKGTLNPRGHIGSEMIRECEGILVIKISKGIRTLTSDFEHGKGRNSTHASTSFIWCNKEKMFVSCDTPTSEPGTNKKKVAPTDIDNGTYKRILIECFKNGSELNTKDLNIQLRLSTAKIYGSELGRDKVNDIIIHLQNESLILPNGTIGTRNFFYTYNPIN